MPRPLSALALLGLIVCAPAAPLRAAPDAGPATASPWKTVAPGVQSAAAAEVGGDAGWAARVLLIDPRRARLSVQFDAARPTLSQWRTRFPDAIAIANGSFYSAGASGEARPTCDLVVSGAAIRGAGCRRQDALFFGAAAALAAPVPRRAEPSDGGIAFAQSSPREAPGQAAADGGLAAECPRPAAPGGVRFLEPQEFVAGEWADAFKSFPALVRDCAPACAGAHYCRERSRTAALAQLRDGKLVLFASQWPAVRQEVGRFLAESLGAAQAVNLDGGPEATLALRGEPLEQTIGLAGTGLPLVLVVLPAQPAPPRSQPR